MLKKTFYFSILLIITFITTDCYAFTSQPQLTPRQETAVMNKLVSAMDYLSKNKGHNVWDGYDPTITPTIIKFDSGNIYAVGLKSSDPTWKKVSFTGRTILMSNRDKWGLKDVQMNPSFPIENQMAFVYHYEYQPEDPFLSIHVFIHERFHQYQFESFQMNRQDEQTEYKEQFNVENVALMQLEEKVLKSFVAESNLSDKKNRLVDYLIVNEERTQLIPQAAVDWENHQQKMEGLADYVGFRLYDCCSFLPGSGLDSLQKEMEHGKNMGEITDQAVKWRHYGVGASLAYALDVLGDSQWKQKIESGQDNLRSLVARQLNFQKSNKRRFEQIKNEYGYQTIYADVKQRINSHLSEIKRVKSGYQNQRGIPVLLGNPMVSISGGGTNSNLYHLDDGSVVGVNDTSVTSTYDNAWNLKLERIPYVFETRQGFKEFKCDENVVFKLDNKNISLKSLKRRPLKRNFKSLSWKSGSSEFRSDRYPGEISSDGQKVTIRFYS